MGMTRNKRQIRGEMLDETLRLVVALYVMGAAIGLWATPGSSAPLGALFGPALAANLYAIALFSGAWCVLVGLHLQKASLGLMALVLLTAAASGGVGWAEILLALALLPLIGALSAKHPHPRPPQTGRIRLRHISAPRRPQQAACTAPSAHPFSQSPDDLACLFDQIREVR
ncbi:MAG TPA: hypothetical protein ENK83_00995 [Aliiroseovarius sp.]|nr:hypothetical protein [Aliiroseovarius sp.]